VFAEALGARHLIAFFLGASSSQCVCQCVARGRVPGTCREFDGRFVSARGPRSDAVGDASRAAEPFPRSMEGDGVAGASIGLAPI
jgi:hypothetical protein